MMDIDHSGQVDFDQTGLSIFYVIRNDNGFQDVNKIEEELDKYMTL